MKVSAYHFFLKHAGWSYRPEMETQRQGRIRCAKALAQAERDGERFGLTFRWADDSAGADLSWMTEAELRESHEVEGCTALSPDGRPVAGLYGIVDADATYRRVVEAQLASEALASVAHV
jgi:hypothetical protein